MLCRLLFILVALSTAFVGYAGSKALNPDTIGPYRLEVRFHETGDFLKDGDRFLASESNDSIGVFTIKDGKLVVELDIDSGTLLADISGYSPEILNHLKHLFENPYQAGTMR